MRAVVFTLLFAACAQAPLAPEVPAPSDDRILELARQRTQREVREAPMSASFFPAIILAGRASWLRCHLPRSLPAGDLIVEAPTIGIRIERELDLIEFKRLIEHIPCGEHTATCRVVTREGRTHTARATLIARGCEDSGDRL